MEKYGEFAEGIVKAALPRQREVTTNVELYHGQSEERQAGHHGWSVRGNQRAAWWVFSDRMQRPR